MSKPLLEALAILIAAGAGVHPELFQTEFKAIARGSEYLLATSGKARQ